MKKALSRIGSASELVSAQLSGRHRRKSSLDPAVTDFESLEAPLEAKTDLVDDLSAIWPLNVQVPGIVVVGARGAGKSTLLQTLTGVPLPHNGPMGPTRRPIRIQIVADPTAKKCVGGGCVCGCVWVWVCGCCVDRLTTANQTKQNKTKHNTPPGRTRWWARRTRTSQTRPTCAAWRSSSCSPSSSPA